MKYKGYTGIVEFDEEAGVLFGRVIGLRDVITFQGESVAETIQAFRDSVDDYLEFCAERGESPEKPYSGQFVLRIDPQLHRALSHAAEERGVSLNSLVEEELRRAMMGSSQGRVVSARGPGDPVVRESGGPRRRRAGGARGA
jgi:predicted HicB family RNase H-like nuclease